MDSNHTSDKSADLISELMRQVEEVADGKLPLGEIHDWNQRQRDKWVEAKASTLIPGSKILDVGAGTCPYKKNFSHCSYQAHDFKLYASSDYLKREEDLPPDGYGKIDFVSDITALPVDSSSFDAVLCTEVFEHIPEPIPSLQEISRVLKPGGKLFLTAPLASGLLQLPFHFYGGFTPEWYKRFCKEMGLKIISIETLGGYFKMLSQELARFAWTIEEHKFLHGDRVDELSDLFSNKLSRYFYSLESKCLLDKFTAGYLVEAERVSDIKELQDYIDSDPNNSRLYISAVRLALDLDNLEIANRFMEDYLEISGETHLGQVLQKTINSRRAAIL